MPTWRCGLSILEFNPQNSTPPLPHPKKICPNSTFKKPPNAHPLFPPKESPNLSV